LQIVAFPSNEFGGQEPWEAKQIREFVNKFGVTFYMMEKTTVNGPSAHPIFQALKLATGSEKVDIRWNFETKFLIGRDGITVERFSAAFDPDELVPFIDRLMVETSPSPAL
jgi:glutathione peroxidase